MDSNVLNEIEALNAEHAAELAKVRLDCAVEIALVKAGAKNPRAVRALIELPEGTSVGSGGVVAGLDDAIGAVRASDPYLFESDGSGIELSGVMPAKSMGESPDFSRMTYSQISDYLAANPGVDFGRGAAI